MALICVRLYAKSIGMKANEIRADLVRNNITVTSIARSLNMAIPTVSQVISGVRSNPRIRQAIATSINKPVSDIWPDKDEV